MTQYIHVTPVPKPRQTRADKWKTRPSVLRYRRFADDVRKSGVFIPDCGARVTFLMPMPASWSKKKCSEMYFKPHQQRPDIDNLLKALLDALFEDDCRVWNITAEKRWAHIGAIEVTNG